MYSPHPLFHSPHDPNIRVWHYMDLFKFLSLLDSSALYFARLDTLDDPFEGEMTAADYRACTDVSLSDAVQKLRRKVHVNCWHMNAHESAAMWKIYSHAGQGIAIQSTFERMSAAFNDGGPSVHVGMVEYRDYATDRIVGDDIERVVLSKRKSYEYEHELRAAIILHDETDEERGGTPVPVNFDMLIESIYLSPALHTWQEKTLRSVLERFGIAKLLRRSELGLPSKTY